MKAVQRIKDFRFPGNLPPPERRYPFKIDVSADTIDYDPLQHGGAWQNLGPPEEPLACLMAAEALVFSDKKDEYGGESNHTELCLGWLKTLLTVTYQWNVVALGFDTFIAGQNKRDGIGARAKHLEYTLGQRVDLVGGVIAERERVLGRNISQKDAALFLSNIKIAPGAEAYSESYVIAALNVKKKVLSNQKSKLTLRSLADFMSGQSNPLRSVNHMQEIINRCASDNDLIADVLELLVDFTNMDFIGLGDLSHRKLRDQSKSLVEIAKVMLAVRAELITNFLPSLASTSVDKAHAKDIREKLYDIDKFRSLYAPYPGRPAPSLQFQRNYSPRLLEFVSYCTNMTWSMQSVSLCKHIVEQYKGGDDLLALPTVVRDLENIKQEAGAEDVDEAAAASSSQDQQTPAQKVMKSPSKPIVERAESGLTKTDDEEWDAHVEACVRRGATLLVEAKSSAALLEDLKKADMIKDFHEKGWWTLLLFNAAALEKDCIDQICVPHHWTQSVTTSLRDVRSKPCTNRRVELNLEHPRFPIIALPMC